MKRYNITVNGTVYEVEVEEVAADAPQKVTVPPVRPESAPAKTAVPAQTESAPAKTAQLSVPGAAGSVKITSPMPGNILKVSVNVGEQIKKGGILCLLEAMKMENEILSPIDCTVVSVNTQQGVTVQTGELLFTLN